MAIQFHIKRIIVRASAADCGAIPPPPQDPQLKCDEGGLFLQWRPVEGTVYYRYRLLSKGKRILQSRTAETSIHLGAGDPGQKYTARVRAKTENGISKWASVKTKCRAAAPIPAPSVTFTIDFLGRDYANLEWSWKHLPASTEKVVVILNPEVDYNCDGHAEAFWRPFSEGKDSTFYNSLCPDTSYHWEFAIQHKSGSVDFVKEAYFRTLP